MICNNFIIHEQAHQYQWPGDCFLSIKSFYYGNAHYQVNQREHLVNDKNLLILNECTKYDLTIDNTNLTESFCVFFSPTYVIQAVSEWQANDEQPLDFSFKKQEDLQLIECNYPHGGEISSLQQTKTSKTRNSNELEREEFYYKQLNAIFALNKKSLYHAK